MRALRLARFISLLLENGVHAALVTAAGYGYDTAKYETRLSGLLDYFAEQQAGPPRCPPRVPR